MKNKKKLQELIEQRKAIEAETPGKGVQDLDAWREYRQRRLNEIDAQLSDLRNETARNVADFEKRGSTPCRTSGRNSAPTAGTSRRYTVSCG